jgi:hypothetical protein
MMVVLTPNIWLSTYYIAVKVAGGNFDHMVAYFPLVMGDTPSLAQQPPGKQHHVVG